MGLPADHRAAIGNWQEAAANDPRQVRETLRSMASRYDHGKLHVMAAAKQACCVALQEVAVGRDSYDVSWAQLRAHAPSCEALLQRAGQVCSELETEEPQPTSSSSFPLRPSRLHPEVNPAQVSQEPPQAEAMAAASAWRWIVPQCSRGGKIHTVLEESDRGAVAACGRVLKQSGHSGVGVHTALLVSSVWCAGCFARLPAEVQSQCGGQA